MRIDPVAYVGAVIREVTVRERDGKPARAVIATRSYDTDITDLWDALTNPERIPRWFLANLRRSETRRPLPVRGTGRRPDHGLRAAASACGDLGVCGHGQLGDRDVG